MKILKKKSKGNLILLIQQSNINFVFPKMKIYLFGRRYFKYFLILYPFLFILIIYHSQIILYLKKETFYVDPLLDDLDISNTNQTNPIFELLRSQFDKVTITKEKIEKAKKLPKEAKMELRLVFVQIIDEKVKKL